MSKLNPLHAEALESGRLRPSDLETHRATGATTSAALQLLATAVHNPNGTVSPTVRSNTEDARGSEFREKVAIVERALQLAEAAGLRHIHRQDKASIIFEYRPHQ